MNTHLKKCDICGRTFEESTDLDYLDIHGPAQCPYCKEIISLRKVLSDYYGNNMDFKFSNEIFDRNMIVVGTNKIGLSVMTTRELAPHKQYYRFEGRGKIVKDLIERIKKARDLIYFRLGPQFEILDSIYDKHNAIWKEGGNLMYFVNDASIQYVIIKLKELISGSKSSCSIEKIKNIIINNKKTIYSQQKIYSVFEFTKSGEKAECLYTPFPIVEYLEKMNDVLSSYKKEIDAINDLRNNEYAHIGKVKNEDSIKTINYCSLKRIFNSARIIYDGFLFSVAPDLFGNIVFESNMWFDHLDIIAKDYKARRNR